MSRNVDWRIALPAIGLLSAEFLFLYFVYRLLPPGITSGKIAAAAVVLTYLVLFLRSLIKGWVK